MYAALKTQVDTDYQALRQPRDINIDVRVNAQGQLMLLHSGPFNVIPLWVRYYNTARMLEVLFEDGYAWPVDLEISDHLHTSINRSAKINLIWVENNNVVENWETILLNDTY